MKNEYRYNQITGQWVVIAPGRAKRPGEFVKNKKPIHSIKSKDFFLEGNESMIPKEVFAIRKPGTRANAPGWTVRVVPNKYPVFDKPRIKNKVSRIKGNQEPHNVLATGHHEIVITRDPKKDIGKMTVSQVAEVVYVFMERYRALSQDKHVTTIAIIQNHGPAAGASIAHPHSQIFAFSHFQGSLLDAELSQACLYWKQRNKKVLAVFRDQEMKNKKRIVYHNDFFVALCPYASRFPFEVWIVPKNNLSDFSQMSEVEAFSYAQILQKVLSIYNIGLKDPDYNMYLRTPPVRFVSVQEGEEAQNSFLWYTAISPRFTVYGGFEYATDMIINPVTPEDAAQFLKKYI